MKLVTYYVPTAPGARRAGALVQFENQEHVLDIAMAARRADFADVLSLLRAGPTALAEAGKIVEDTVARWSSLPEGAAFPLAAVRLDAPLPRPGKIICIGMNYFPHLYEVRGAGATPPPAPRAFMKAPSCVVPTEASIPYPPWTDLLDYEVEFAVVIGTACVNVSPEEALAHVAGYVILNDMSVRDVQRAEMQIGLLNLGKNFPGAAPMGPYILTADELPDPHVLNLELKVNDEVRQRGYTGDLIHKVPDLITYWSRMGLEPGDVISTGTPSGVAMGREPDMSWYLRPGDVIEATVERLGTLRTVIAE